MPLGELVGQGAMCDVYALGEGQVVKLFQPGVPREWVENEARLAAAVHEAGLPSPWVGAITEQGGRLGIVYERLTGPLLDEVVTSHPAEVLDLARHLAEIHSSIHRLRIPTLPSQRAGFRRSIGRAPLLTDRLRAKALRVLESLPDGDAVCHGDLHPRNVIITPNGWKVIDWNDARRGNPLADVARTVLHLDAGALYARSAELRKAVESAEPPARDAYLARYLKLSQGSLSEIAAWRMPVAAARLRENVDVEEDWLLSIVRDTPER